ncbi:MAG: hypothetical protein HY717_00920 [Planctomycetes bacterium]|nr:hypothetical protein [Planctomycetota bacterium]
MELQHVNVKVSLPSPGGIDPEGFIPVFHGWIQDQVLEELLIDVASYAHVINGPGVVLIGHRADYSIDSTGGRLGLRYNHKAPLSGSNFERFKQSARAALQACRLLEENPQLKGLRFNAGELELFVNDRALAPNTPEIRAACEPELREFFQWLYQPIGFALELEKDPRQRFGARAKAVGAVEIKQLLERLKG